MALCEHCVVHLFFLTCVPDTGTTRHAHVMALSACLRSWVTRVARLADALAKTAAVLGVLLDGLVRLALKGAVIPRCDVRMQDLRERLLVRLSP